MHELKIIVSGAYFQTIIKIQTFGNIIERAGGYKNIHELKNPNVWKYNREGV